MARSDVKRSFLRRWIISYTASIMVPFLLFVAFALTSVYVIRTSVDKANRAALSSVENELNSAFKQVDSICDVVLLSDSFKSLGSLKSIQELDPYSLYTKTQEIWRIASSIPYIDDFVLYSPSLDYYFSTQYNGKLSDLQRNDVLGIPPELLSPGLFSEVRTYTHIEEISFESDGYRSSYLMVFRPLSFVRSSNIGDFCAVALINISRILSPELSGLYDILVYDDEAQRLIFDYGNNFSSDYVTENFAKIPSGSSRGFGGNMVLSSQSSMNGIRFFILTEERQYFQDLYRIIQLGILLLVLTVVISIVVTHRLVMRQWNSFSTAVRATGTDVSDLSASKTPYDPFVSSVSRLKRENRSHVVSAVVYNEDCQYNEKSLEAVGVSLVPGCFGVLLAQPAAEGRGKELDTGALVAVPFSSEFGISLFLNGSEEEFSALLERAEASDWIEYCAMSNPVQTVQDVHKAYLQTLNIMNYKRSASIMSSGGEGFALSNAALAEIENNYSDCQLNVSLIADRLEVSIPYLSKCFKKYNDMNISDYLTSYRISKAKKLMEDNPSMLVASVSEMCGFGSTRTFMRVFKASEGITPGQFRASLGIQE